MGNRRFVQGDRVSFVEHSNPTNPYVRTAIVIAEYNGYVFIKAIWAQGPQVIRANQLSFLGHEP